MDMRIRRATPEDSRVLAVLMNLAGDGIPAFLWSRMAGPGEDAMAFGAGRVARTEGGFSYTNAHVAEMAGQIAGLLLTYRLPDPYDTSGIADAPDVVKPLLELEAEVPGSWYINAIATDPDFRGQGAGSRLMRLAEDQGREAGAKVLSLIVAQYNRGAVRLYERLGYETVARRPIVPYPGCPHAGDWILMRKPVADVHTSLQLRR